SWLKKILLIASLFFLGSLAFAAWVVWRGDNWVSAANVEIEIAGPVAVASGGEVELQVVVTNNNQATLEGVRLLGEYPPGTRSAENSSVALPRSTAEIGSLKPGEQAKKTIRAVIFGEKDSTQEIKLSVEYRLAGSGAIFDRLKSYPVMINSSPVNLALELPDTVDSGREFTFTATLTSGAVETINNLVFSAVYPPGFRFKKAVPAPVIGNNFWRLSALPAGKDQEIKITGTLEGDDEETKSFRVTAGLEDLASEGETSLIYGSLFKLVTLRRTAVALDLVLNGSREETLAVGSNELVRGDFGFTNNLPVELRDVVLEVGFTGANLNRGAISATGGFYNSANNKIVWNKTNQSSLGVVAPGGRANVSFGFSGDALAPNPGSAPQIDLKLRFSGRRFDTESDEPVVLELERTVRFNSILQLSTKVLRDSGPFIETGPIPPRVGAETTYTVVWSVANRPNEVAGAQVRAILPTYMRWVGQVSPSDEKITYNATGGEIIWDLGVVKAGRGYTEPPRQVAFQVALTPSLSQLGQVPELVSAAILTGTDRFTNVRLESRKLGLNTDLSQEPAFNSGDEKVVN
ncbi:MAG: hypothetical protein AAB589_00155, partial [Patescibacteria group bacterium]